MLGKIIGVEGNTILVKSKINIEEANNIINLYVKFTDGDIKIIGEIVDIKDNIIYINLVGEFKNNKFMYGISSKPSFRSTVDILEHDKIIEILGIPDYNERKDLYLGRSPIYSDVKIGININDFFSNHFAIFGSTGSGKSCSVARIFQNLFEKNDPVPYRASILIFDAYGEYHSAFCELSNKVPEITFKSYTTNTNDSNNLKLQLPFWLLTVDDIALLLEADKRSELPIIEKALKLVNIFARKESENVLKSKNDIIARALIDILSSGHSPAQIRDQIFSVLSHYNTKDLNLDTQIFQPGYTRPLKQCLLIDSTGKIREMELLTTFIGKFICDDLELSLPDGTFKYTLKDFYMAFEFALISEGILNSEKVYDMYNSLKVRLRTLLNSEYAKYFDIPEYMNIDSFIKDILTINHRKAQIVNFNINYVDDRFAKTIVKIYSRIFFEYAKGLDNRASLPIHIILEEAHRYVQNDNDINVIGYNIFERISKEGRKYAVMLGLISQRPSELSSTALSQCSNFLIFKMMHPTDVEYIKQMVPNITSEIVKKLKLLQPGTCIAFGSGFKVPSLIKFKLPNPTPSSSSCDISNIWFVDRK